MFRLRSVLVALSVLAGCSGDSGGSSCVVNSDCESSNCVNGLCVGLPDAAVGFRDVELSDTSGSTDDASIDAASDTMSDSPPGCVPWTCETLGQVCRGADDGCGGRLEWGAPGTTTHRSLEWGATQYVNWTFAGGEPRDRVEHELCFDEVPSVANGFGRGMFFQVYDGTIEEQGFYVGYQDAVSGIGDLRNTSGALFSKFGDRDVTHLRPGPTAVVVNDDSEGGFISLRMALPLAVGCYKTTLVRGEADAGGDWIIIRIESGGVGYQLGEVWFERSEPEETVRFPNGAGTWVEFYNFSGRTSDEVPRYDLRASILGDGQPPSSMLVRYHRRAGDNSSCEYLPESDEVRMLVGGDSFRCVPGTLMGDLYETRWDVPR